MSASNTSSNSNRTSQQNNREVHNDTRNSGDFSSNSLIDSRTINGPYYVGNAADNLCSYLPLIPGESCQEPRTCYDCLNVNVMGMTTGCLLSPSGFCKDMSNYEMESDFRRNTTKENLRLTGWYNYFPSVNTTYCKSTDEACVLCNELMNNGSLNDASNLETVNMTIEVERRFCRGVNGCVCVMACESDQWKENMPVKCDDSGSTSGSNYTSSANAISYSTMLLIYLVLQLVMLAVYMYKRKLCRRSIRPPCPRREGPYNNVDAIRLQSNQLRLSGWRRMQNALIEREKEQSAIQQPQYMSSPRVEAVSVQTEVSSQAQPLSPLNSARNRSDTAEAAYREVQDDSSRQRHNNVISSTHQAASVDLIAVERCYDERRRDATEL